MIDEPAARFWSWFAANASALRTVAGSEDLLLDRLHGYCPELFFEIGGAPGGATELIITAEGDRSRFDAVRALVAAAPALVGWTFIAFRPPQGFAFVTRHERAEIDAE